MTKIKICGITNIQDALDAASLGVDMLGFVFYDKSKRYVAPEVVRDIANELAPKIGKVGVFVDEEKERILQIADVASLNMLQFHGSESPEFCASFSGKFKVIKAFRLKDRHSLDPVNGYDVNYFLLDTYKTKMMGGSGEVFDWKMLEDFEFLKPIIVSGGLTPENVEIALKKIAPFGVDISSGVEKSPGRKDLSLMKKFVEKVRRVD